MSTERVLRTLAVRLELETHARLSLLARLSDTTVTDIIRVAIEERLAVLAADPTLAAKAEATVAAIQAEAAEQQAALKGLFAASAATPPTRATGSKSAR